ncbi:MAG: aminodeoxychorismate synthase component I [Bacteroidota bacterium]|nr:aminodeoxychorismate synthase component I [Bacteroidota bacterium]
MDNKTQNTKHGQTVIDRAFLFSELQKEHTVLLESSRQDEKNNKNLLFSSPIAILSANNLSEIPMLFASIEKHIKNKKWIAGYISYECAYHFESNIVDNFHNNSSFPLLWFGVYDSPVQIQKESLDVIIPDSQSRIENPRLLIDDQSYKKSIEQLKEYIVNGDTYQVNFTNRFEFDITSDAAELYFSLRKKQHVPYGAFINLGNAQILSFSPELFFKRNINSISTKPMKGTVKRGRTLDEDYANEEWLRNDEKNRSENLMIVDLLRNDIGRICETSSVEVENMYSIERYETVIQMTSTVTGLLKTNTSYYDIFKSLFPCGSVTGAPKIRTMQIINELENHRRGVYCGAIGFISPDNEAVFNVAIRTIESQNGKGTMGVGSGIVSDSEPHQELEECKLKAAFLLNDEPDFQLLETILWDGKFIFFDNHLMRMKNSADYFSFDFQQNKIFDAIFLAERSFDRRKKYRVRLLLSKNSEPFVEAFELLESSVNNQIKIAPVRTNSADRFLFHKTTNRKIYDRYSVLAKEENLADYIFLNERDEITEGSITNIFIEKDGKLFTPPLSSGLLSGVYRQEVLRTNQLASEMILTISDLHAADTIYICNSVRGWQKVTLCE